MARPRKHYGKWRIRWVDEHRGRHSETFDTFDEAVFAQQQRELEVKELMRRLRGPIQPNKTVGDICDYWLERRTPWKRNHKDDRNVIKRHLRALLGEVRLRDLTVGCTDLLRAQRTHFDLKTTHNILTLLISMLNVAVDQEAVEHRLQVLALGQLAGDDAGEAVLLQGLHRDGAEELIGRGELGEQALEVGAAEGDGDGSDQSRLGSSRQAEEQDVLTGEDGGEGAVDDVLALGEVGGEVGAEGVERGELLALGHDWSFRAGRAGWLGRPGRL